MVHEAYCFRNFVKCMECDNMIDKNNKKEHQDEFHKTVICGHCEKTFAGQELLKKHELFCSEKPKICNFCNLEIKFKEYSSHIYHCSTRTQKCELCGKFIIMRDFEDHLPKCMNNASNQSFPPLNVLIILFGFISNFDKFLE